MSKYNNQSNRDTVEGERGQSVSQTPSLMNHLYIKQPFQIKRESRECFKWCINMCILYIQMLAIHYHQHADCESIIMSVKGIPIIN